jgi:serine/threonine protein kinase
MADRVGTEIAGYRIESQISRGGMGEVYLAEQDAPRRKVALKFLAPELSEDEGFRERFARESEAAASIDHPNVIPIYASGEADGTLFIAMRYVEGTNLSTLLAEQGPLPPDRAVRICAQIADALEAAHERGLVHRDVKPANILIGRADHAYLSDFGLIRRSEVSTAITKTGQFMGTIDYVAPEQIKGEAIDGRADIYSLGCVLYECLAGEPPFRHETEVATLYAHLEDPSPVPSAKVPTVPAALDEVVARAMAKRPDERYATAAELGIAIRAAAQSEIIGPAKPFLERGLSPRVTAFLIGAGALIAVAVIVALLVSEFDGDSQTGQSASQVSPNGLVQVDAKSLAVTQLPKLPVNQNGIAAGSGSIWTINNDGLSRIDLDTSSVVETIDLSAAPIDVATDYGYVWVLEGAGLFLADVAKIDPTTNAVVDTIAIPGDTAQAHPYALALGGGSVWVVGGNGSVWEIDPLRNRIIRQGALPADTTDAAYARGWLWVNDELHDSVLRVDPKTLAVDKTFELNETPNVLTPVGHSIWFVSTHSSSVGVIEASGQIRSIGIGGTPTGIAFGQGAVWVSDPRGQVTRIDPGSEQRQVIANLGGVQCTQLGNRTRCGSSVTVENGVVWVAFTTNGIGVARA